MISSRREFLRSLGMLSLGYGATASTFLSCSTKPTAQQMTDSTKIATHAPSLFFKISLAEWSLHRALKAGTMTNLDFPGVAKNEYGISAVEYVNQFFFDKANDQDYLRELKKRCSDNGVTSVLIMCDNEGYLADTDAKKRATAIENHFKWVEAAKFLDCHAIRVNCFGQGTAEEVAKAGIDGLHALADFAAPFGIHVIVENHGGYSSDGMWMSDVIRKVNLPNCGTLPDFGNFCLRREKGDMWESPCVETYDRYKGVKELLPFAKGVSAKTYDFDETGNCVETDYSRMLPIVKESGYHGYIGIEYEGSGLSEPDGIRATKALLERTGIAS